MSHSDFTKPRKHCDFSCTEKMCVTLDKAGAPRDNKWRTLILYMRGLKDYDYLTDEQKAMIQSLVVKTLTERDYSDDKFHEILRKKEAILNAPYQKKLKAAVEETAIMLKEARELINSRRGDVQELKDMTLDVLESSNHPDEIVIKLRDAFQDLITVMEQDADNLSKMSKTDGLTRINNRRALDDYLDDIIAEWVEAPFPISLLMLDIDHFKKFNDNYGHRIGDQALITVAKILKQYGEELRAQENMDFFPARYGGEEFAVVMPGVNQRKAASVAEIIRKRIERYNFIIRDSEGNVLQKNIKITVSLGAADMDARWPGAYKDNLTDAADKALYIAKARGRNQVVSYIPVRDTDPEATESQSSVCPSQ